MLIFFTSLEPLELITLTDIRSLSFVVLANFGVTKAPFTLKVKSGSQGVNGITFRNDNA